MNSNKEQDVAYTLDDDLLALIRGKYDASFGQMTEEDVVKEILLLLSKHRYMSGDDWYNKFAEILDNYDAVGLGEDNTAHFDVRVVHTVAAKAAGIES